MDRNQLNSIRAIGIAINVFLKILIEFKETENV